MLAEDQAMQSRSVGEHEPEVVFRDGVAYFRRVFPAKERTSMPRDLIRDPPEWVQALVGKSASVSEFLAVLGARARDVRTVEQRKELLTVFEQFAQWGEGRGAADLVLGPDFIYKLTVDYEPTVVAPAGLMDPAILLSVELPFGPDVWLNPWQDEFVWPESELQSRFLDRGISKVWLNNWRPFVELFLFDGPDLQGRMARFARVWTPNADLPIELDEPVVARSCTQPARWRVQRARPSLQRIYAPHSSSRAVVRQGGGSYFVRHGNLDARPPILLGRL